MEEIKDGKIWGQATEQVNPTDRFFANLLGVIKTVHEQHADDLCWMDIDLIFTAAGLPVPDRKLCSKQKQLKSCELFVNYMCSGGSGRKSYQELEEQYLALQQQFKKLVEENAELIREATPIKPSTPLIQDLIKKEATRTEVRLCAVCGGTACWELVDKHTNRTLLVCSGCR